MLLISRLMPEIAVPVKKVRVSAAKRRDAGAETDRISQREARRTRRREASRSEILDAARIVLLRDGVTALTLEAVANEAGMSKTGLYYYFASKDALVFELVFGVIERQAHAVHDAVEQAGDGGAALRAIIRETVRTFAARLDDFRLAFLFGQVAGAGSVHWNAEQFGRIRPLNDLTFAGAAKMLRVEQTKGGRRRAQIEPRLLAFLAYLAAIGLLTMKGMVEHMDDPLLFSDEQLIEGFGRVFEAAASV
jgi:AcrR family transcriptional regulator